MREKMMKSTGTAEYDKKGEGNKDREGEGMGSKKTRRRILNRRSR